MFNFGNLRNIINIRDIVVNKLSNFIKNIVVTHGAFSGGLIGALLGAVGTIIAGWLAWQGVQEQIFHQKQANDLTELNFLQSESDRLYSKLQMLLRLNEVLILLQFSKYALVKNDPQEIEKIIGDVYKSVEYIDEKIKPLESDLTKGVAGIVGLDAVQRMDSCKSALVVSKSLSSKSSEKMQLFFPTKVSENPRDSFEYKMLPLAGSSYVDHFRSELINCFEDIIHHVQRAKNLKLEINQQIRDIDAKTSKIREIYSK